MKLPKLKPCPFCGGEARFRAELHDGDNSIWMWIKCTGSKCGAELECNDISYADEEWAVLEQLFAEVGALAERWNTRVDDEIEGEENAD